MFRYIISYESGKINIVRKKSLLSETKGTFLLAEKEGFVCIFAREWAKMKVLPLSSRRQATLIRVALKYSNPTLAKKNTTSLGGVLFWRRRRDLNPRYPFGVYTISNRARSASYATSPYRCHQLAYITAFIHFCQE